MYNVHDRKGSPGASQRLQGAPAAWRGVIYSYIMEKGRLSGFLKAPQGQLRGSEEHPLRAGDWGHLHYGKGATQWFSNGTPEETQGLQGASVACGGGGNLHYGKGTIKFYISYSI